MIYPTYYPTNHVALRYGANQWDISDAEDLRYIYKTFYQLASVPLVREYVHPLTQDDTELYVQSVSHETEHAPHASNDLSRPFLGHCGRSRCHMRQCQTLNFLITAAVSDIGVVVKLRIVIGMQGYDALYDL